MRKVRSVVSLIVFASFFATGVCWPTQASFSQQAGYVSDWVSDQTPPPVPAQTVSMNFDFVSSEEVEQKKVTVYFENVPIDDALDNLIAANNLRYKQKEGSRVFIVYPADADIGDLETRVFHLKFARLSISPLDIGGGKVISDLTASESSQVGTALTTTNVITPSSGSNASYGGSASSDGGSNGSSVGVSAARGIDILVSKLLSKRGGVTSDISTNTLVVTDTVDKLNEIAKVIETLDVPASQVSLEVHLLEVRKDLLDDIGVDWGGTNGALGVLTGASMATTFPFNATSIFGGGLNASGAKVAGTAANPRTVTPSTLAMANLTATLRYITSRTDAKVLAEPRVLTQNNEAAIIKLMTNTTVQVISTTVNQEGSATALSQSSVPQREPVGITLKMTPQINKEDGSVTLYVEPTVSTVSAASLNSSYYDPTTRTLRTTARVKNHETLVIGGLLDSNRKTREKQVPFLGDIPFLGNAFKYTDRDDIDRELVIFITPHIVEDSDRISRNKTGAFAENLSLKRALNSFKDQEMDLSMGPYEELERDRQQVYFPRKKSRVGPLVESEMNKALGNVSPGNARE
ncbi:MAG: secretin and TonB N-terminal domain-containing protein [Candidatus Omnitrophica bacterium]|nr:secretin and TonB N-terminal domain-containing protein [Candidatus Omnitrophota bacterium]